MYKQIIAAYEIHGQIKLFISGSFIDKDIQQNGKYLGWFQQELIQSTVSEHQKDAPEFELGHSLPPPSLKVPYKQNSVNDEILQELKKISETLEYIYKNNR